MSKGESPLSLSVVTPERSVLEEGCASVSLPATEGYLTVLPGHTSLVSTLAVGVLSYRQGTKEGALALSGGFFEVSDDVVTVLTQEAQLPDEIDAEAARKELQEASDSLGRLSGEELRQARLTVQRAEARLAVSSKQ